MLRPDAELPVVPPVSALKRRWLVLLILDCLHLRPHFLKGGRRHGICGHFRRTTTAKREQRRDGRWIVGVQHRILLVPRWCGRHTHSTTEPEDKKNPLPERKGDRAGAGYSTTTR